MADYFCAADLVVQPYKNATQSGVSQIAYHFERPMLVADVWDMAELIPDGEVGYVVPPSAKAIADALRSPVRLPRSTGEECVRGEPAAIQRL